ncbi:hypothetical protein C8J41_1301 [Sphingomonas sp. PP-CC-3G-468]|nr:hypothetical protein C8J41_1301 [Sphingomonas sp. PP-CC-3G-468]
MVDDCGSPLGIRDIEAKGRARDYPGNLWDDAACNKHKVQGPASGRLGRNVMPNRSGGQGEKRLMASAFGEIGRVDQKVDRSRSARQPVERMIRTNVRHSAGAGEGATGSRLRHRVLGGVEQCQCIRLETARGVDHANDHRRSVGNCWFPVCSKPEHDGVAAGVVGQEDRQGVCRGLMGGADVANAGIASIRAPRVGHGREARNLAHFWGGKADSTRQSTERVAERSLISGRHRANHMLVITQSLGRATCQKYALTIIGHYGKYRHVLRSRNAG